MSQQPKKKKIQAGIYDVEGFRIVKNIHADYGYPSSAWVVSDPDQEELGAIWTLSDAVKWVGEMLTDPFSVFRRKK